MWRPRGGGSGVDIRIERRVEWIDVQGKGDVMHYGICYVSRDKGK